MPDRSSVSQSASQGWLGVTSKNFPSQPLDDILAHDSHGNSTKPHPNHTPDTQDDCKTHNDPSSPFLDNSYQHPNRNYYVALLSTLSHNHQQTMQNGAASWASARYIEDVEYALRSAARDAF